MTSPHEPLDEVLYTADAIVEGGRSGHARTNDHRESLP